MTWLKAAPKPAPRAKRDKKPLPRKPLRHGPPRVRDRAYLDWIKGQQRCVVAGTVVGNLCGIVSGEREMYEPMHVKTKGSGGADRGNTVCGCQLHHDEQEGDTEGFESVYRVSLKLEAAKLLVRYITAGEP